MTAPRQIMPSVLALVASLSCHRWDLECAGDFVDGDILIRYPVPVECVQRPFHEPCGDEVVEPARYDSDFLALAE